MYNDLSSVPSPNFHTPKPSTWFELKTTFKGAHPLFDSSDKFIVGMLAVFSVIVLLSGHKVKVGTECVL